jgi:hypothetical protein
MTPNVARYLTSVDQKCHEEEEDCTNHLSTLHSEESEAIRIHLSSLTTSSVRGTKHPLSALLGGSSVQIHPLPRLLRKSQPVAGRRSWDAYRKNTAQWDTFRSKWNTSVVHVTGKFATDDKFADEVTFASTFNMMKGGRPPNRLTFHYQFPDHILQDPRWKKHTDFVAKNNTSPSSSFGGGYWFWKGPLIHHQLVENPMVKMGDFVIYTDSDLFDHWLWMSDLLETMLRQNQTLALYQMTFPERLYCKRDVLEHYCRTARDLALARGSSQYSGNFLVFRKSSGTIRFVEEWMEGMADFHLISDEESDLPELEVFINHRHDQAILSTMIKCQYKEAGKTQFDGAV